MQGEQRLGDGKGRARNAYIQGPAPLVCPVLPGSLVLSVHLPSEQRGLNVLL